MRGRQYKRIRPVGAPRFDPAAAICERGDCGQIGPLAPPTMQDNQSKRGKTADSGSGSFTSQDDDGTRRASGSQNAGGEAVAGAPAQNGDCNATYESQRHNFSDRGASIEDSPSAGWRAVFYAMEVRVR